MPNYLCLSIDGLHNGMIGAYGNTWIQTPVLDALASQSSLFDRYYAATLDLPETFSQLWQFPPNVRKILLTDDTGIFTHEHTLLFDEKHRLETKQRSQPAGRIEETQFYRGMSTITDLLRNRAEPFLLWAHFEGFRGTWDFPFTYRKQYQIDEDPDPYPGVTLPDFSGKEIDPDVKQSVTETYSGGITVLDKTLSGLLEFLREEGLEQNTTLLVMSVRGFSLGEHRRIGCTEELYGENVHLPLFIRFPDGSFSGFRSQTLLQPGDVWGLLQKDILPEEPDEVHSVIRIGSNVIVTPEWFVYQRHAKSELYVKPDDRWEVNDVADRCAHILEEFTSSFPPTASVFNTL